MITLSAHVLNTLTKSQRLSEWRRNQVSTICWLQKTQFKVKTPVDKSRSMGKDVPYKQTCKKDGKATLISNEVNVKQRGYQR